MKVLLDTHAFLWWVTDDTRLSPKAVEIISDRDNEVYLSAASIWEIAIKVSIGRLTFSGNPEIFITEMIERNNFRILPVAIQHAFRVVSLPNYHKDPFDRMLIAQSMVEEMPLLTTDPLIRHYPAQYVW